MVNFDCKSNHFDRYKDDAEKISKFVEQLRLMAKEECKLNSHLYDKRDVKNLDVGEMAFISYLESSNWNLQNAFNSMSKHSIWRKENDYFDLKPIQIPREIHEIDLFYPFGKDKFGHPLLFIQTSRSNVPKEMQSSIMKHFIWSAELMRNKVLYENHKFAMIFDCRNPSVNISLLKEILFTYTTYYPLTVAYILFIDMNFSFRFIYQIIKYFFPKHFRDHMFLVNMADVSNLIDADNLPNYLGGHCSLADQPWLTDCVPLIKYAQLNDLPDCFVDKVNDYWKKNHHLKIEHNNNVNKS